MEEDMREGWLWGIKCFLETMRSQVFFGDHADFPLKLQTLTKKKKKMAS